MTTPQVVESPVNGLVPAIPPFGFGQAAPRSDAEVRIRLHDSDLDQRIARRTAGREPATRELEAFSLTVSHDLQAPLRQIAGFVDLLAREAGPALTEPCRQYLADIGGAAAHMSALLETLLAYSREGHLGLQSTSVDLESLAREVVAESSRDAAGRRIEWRIGPLPVVRGDRTLLRQVLSNLFANAVKYTRPRAHARIEMGVVPSARPGEVAIFVRDNGAGFDMRLAHKLFNVFERLHPASEFEGTGIGLASVQRIILRHGGRVWATGAVDQGATFCFSLPDAQDSHASVRRATGAGSPS